jgi:DNA-binding response OmpR family regulator
VLLPLPAQALMRAPTSAPPGPPVRSLRLVIVEDNPDLSDLLRDLLEEAGHHVDVAADGLTGATLITNLAPHCAFVDIGLPVLDGYEVARKVRKQAHSTRLVALTGYGQFDDKVRALDAGFDEHLKKPVDIQALEKVLRKVASSVG